jgi:Peptidase family M48
MHFRLLCIVGLTLSACAGGSADQMLSASIKQPERSSIAKPEIPIDQRVSLIVSRLALAANPNCGTSNLTTARGPESASTKSAGSIGTSSENFGPGAADEIETDVPNPQALRRQADHPAAAVICGEYPVVIAPAMIASASTNGQRIQISRGFVQYMRDDSELAFVLAHEMAHILKHHLPVRDASVRYTQELEADRLGFQLVIRAGYNPDAAIELFRRLGRSSDFASSDPRYPTFTARADILHREKTLLTSGPTNLSGEAPPP